MTSHEALELNDGDRVMATDVNPPLMGTVTDAGKHMVIIQFDNGVEGWLHILDCGFIEKVDTHEQ